MRPQDAARWMAPIAVLAALACCGRSDDAALPLPASLDLRVSGTIGDLSPVETRVLVTIDREGVLAVEGQAVELTELALHLVSRTKDMHLREPDGSSLLDVLIAADASLPWRAVAWVLLACADRKVRVYRTCFVVRPEGSGEAGALAAFLPTDGSLRGSDEGEATGTARLVLADGPPPDPAALEEAIASLPESRRRSTLRVKADERTAFGDVVALADAGYRAGVQAVVFEGPISPPGPGETIPSLVAAARSQPAGITLLWDGKALPPPTARRNVPPRVLGHPAGFWFPSGDAQPYEVPWVPVPTSRSQRAGPSPKESDPVSSHLAWLAAHRPPTGAGTNGATSAGATGSSVRAQVPRRTAVTSWPPVSR